MESSSLERRLRRDQTHPRAGDKSNWRPQIRSTAHLNNHHEQRDFTLLATWRRGDVIFGKTSQCPQPPDSTCNRRLTIVLVLPTNPYRSLHSRSFMYRS